MSRIGTIARRTFLFGSLAIAGGVAFGAWYVSRPAPNPLKPGDGETSLNPFVMITAEGVTLVAPRAEMGQGVRTTWAALLAEEMRQRATDPQARAALDRSCADAIEQLASFRGEHPLLDAILAPLFKDPI